MTEMTVRELGEFALIDRLVESLPGDVRSGPELALGIGDDAAVWRPSQGESLVITTDSLVESVHFRLEWTDWQSLGFKALAVNLSDIAAMGGEPRFALISLGLTGSETVAGLLEMYRGLAELAIQYGVLLAGGDVVASPHSMAIHVTALGETRRGKYLTRSGAKTGDVVAVSGTLGASAAGLALLQLHGDDPGRTASSAGALVRSHLRPQPRVELGHLLLEHGATAAMDLSDGLYGDLGKLLTASRVSATIDLDRLPVAAAVRALFPDRWLELATRGGEDYELLFTIPAEKFEPLQLVARDRGSTITAIGKTGPMLENGPELVVRDLNGDERIERIGSFDHFA